MQATRSHFEDYARPNFLEWHKSPTDRRLAMNAAVSISHLCDRLIHDAKAQPVDLLGAADLGSFRNALGRRYASVALIRDVADSHKHMHLDRPSAKLKQLESLREVGPTVWGETAWGEGVWGGDSALVVTVEDGSHVSIAPHLSEVFSVWSDFLSNGSWR